MIPFLPYKELFQDDKGEFNFELQRIIDEGQFILGPDMEKFEQNLAKYIGAKYAVGVNSGTDALFLSMKAMGIGEGDNVIVPSHTFIASIQTIAQTGAEPRLIDIGEDGLMDVTQLNGLINSFTKAILPVHLEGKVCNMDEILKFGYPVIEDAAQALGAKGIGKGLVQCFSFYPAKIMGVPGDAGAITTNDENLYKELLLLRNHYGIGKGVEGKVKFGYNSRLDNLQAAFLNVRFKKLDRLLKRRKEIADVYNTQLRNYPIILPTDQPGRVWQDYVIRTRNVQEHEALVKHLQEKSIGILGHDLTPNHLYDGLDLNFYLPKTVSYTENQIRIPCNAVMTDEDQLKVIQAIQEFYGPKVL